MTKDLARRENNRFIAGRQGLLVSIALACSIGIAVCLYWQGIHGGAFQFDDHPNLSVLGDFGAVESLQHLIIYLKSGIAGPTGRPFSLGSFLLDARTWPTDPQPFLRTNALIHGFNGFLIFLIGWTLLRHSTNTRQGQHALGISALAALFWLLHPLWVSTVLYAVQRMALLSAFFCLAGLALYLKGRALTIDEQHRRRGWWIASIGILCGTGFGILAKENAAVLPVLVLVVETIAVRNMWPIKAADLAERLWLGAFLVVPTVALLVYLGYKANLQSFFETGHERLFTPYERLITQPNILISYLYDLIIPKPGYAGLYQENHPFARGLLSQPWALISLLAVSSLVAFALRFRNSLPLVSLAVLFFFAGHLIESSVLMLELKFEHRNYLPAALLFLPIAAAIILHLPRVRVFVAITAAILLSVFTFSYAALWGRPMDLAVYWAERNPNSYRAQVVAASALDRAGRKPIALDVLREATARHPDSPALRLTNASYLRSAGQNAASDAEVQGALQAIRNGPYDLHAYKITESLVDDYVAGSPFALTRPAILDILAAFEGRHEYNHPRHRMDYAYARARLELADGNLPDACEYIFAMQRYSSRIGTDLLIFALLASNGHFADARYFLAEAENRIPRGRYAGLKFPAEWYYSEIERLRQTLEDDESRQNAPEERTCSNDR